jgi:lysophospholipase L1-like esterase
MDSMKLTRNMKLVFQGDSITDAGRAQPIAEGIFDPMGRGYVNLIDALLNARYPDLNLHVVNVGISGNTSRDLVGRWHRDVVDLKPDWLSLMIGINDVWRQFDMPYMSHTHVYLDEYENNLKMLVGQTRQMVSGITLMTPFVIEGMKDEPFRAMMDRYSAVCKKIAVRNDCVFVDTQAAFDEVLQHQHSARYAWDRIHPNQVGCGVIARAWLKAMDFEL